MQYLSSILDKNYSSFDSGNPPGPLFCADRIKWSGRGQISYIYFNCLFIIDCYTIIIVCRRAPIVYLSIWDAHKQTYLRQRAIFLPGKRLNTRLRSYGPF